MAPTPKAPTPIMALAPWVLILIVGLAASRLAADRLSQGVILAAYLVVAFGCAFFTALGRYLAEAPCPKCRRSALRRLARHPRYFRCPACGMRLRRDWKGAWRDAMGPELDARYCPKSGTWLDAPIAVTDDTTCGTLLGRKRLRDHFLLVFVRDRRKPWTGPRIDPGQAGAIPAPGETTQGALLRNKKARDQRRRP